MAVALGLEITGDGGEGSAEQRRRGDCDDHEAIAGQEAEIERGQSGAEPRDIGLALDADVEEAGMETDRDREASEDEAGGVIEREAEPLEIPDRARDQDLDGFERILADRQNDKAGNEEGRRDVEQRDQRDVRPRGQRTKGRAHNLFSPCGRRWPEGPDEGSHRKAHTDPDTLVWFILSRSLFRSPEAVVLR